jgi:8-oxo-dGTP pyrophosphatase MutT (NUDIX family)
MNTTAVFIEILVIGIEAGISVILLVLAIFGTGWLKADLANGWQSFASFLMLSVAYALGIVVDRVADSLYKWFRERTTIGCRLAFWVGKPYEGKPESVRTMRLHVMEQDDGKAKFLDYQRTRLRIARATVLNLIVLLPVATSFLLARTKLGAIHIVAFELLVLMFIPISFFAAERIGDAYVSGLVEAYSRSTYNDAREDKGESQVSHRALEQIQRGASLHADAETNPDPCTRAAAVCYRRNDTGVEFLLVSTKNRLYWTFPKGRIDVGEEPFKTAQREAREESGALGKPGQESFVEYNYPAKDADPRCKEHRVLAYLLEVERVGKQRPGDRKRRLKWLRPERAKKHLARCRSKRYAREHTRVVDAAMSAIERSGGVDASIPSER